MESEWLVLSRDYETQGNAYKELLGKSEQSKVAVDPGGGADPFQGPLVVDTIATRPC